VLGGGGAEGREPISAGRVARRGEGLGDALSGWVCLATVQVWHVDQGSRWVVGPGLRGRIG